MKGLQDRQGRQFSYLRLSITDACNFKCVYCLPDGYKKSVGTDTDLSPLEIRRLVTGLSELGMVKVRLTGGEPTLRRDLLDIVGQIVSVPGIKKIALSTNGYRLKMLARPLFQMGVRFMNVSVDSLKASEFFKLTGTNVLPQVLGGIDAALEAGFEKVKINTVLLRDSSLNEIEPFIEWVRDKPVTVRWIELMPTAQNQVLFQSQHVSSQKLQERFLRLGWRPQQKGREDGPALEFTHPEYRGKLGIIAPYSKNFCDTCNRFRVTSRGGLRLCLFGQGQSNLRPLLQDESQKDELKSFILQQLQLKEPSHYLPMGDYGDNQTFSAMGG